MTPGHLEPATSLNVVIVNDFASTTGGSAQVALAEVEGLARRGHRVILLAGQGAPPNALDDAGVEVHVLDEPTTLDDPHRVRAARRGIWNAGAARQLRAIGESLDPGASVIHLHGFVKVLSPSVVRAAVGTGHPVVATLHDYFAACPNGGFFNYQRGEPCHLTPLSTRCITCHCDARAYSHKLWRVARAFAQRDLAGMPRELNHFITPSSFAAELLQPFLPPGARVDVLGNPVSGACAEPASVAGNDAYAFLGRLSRDKDPRTFALAARRAEVAAVFAGDGEEAARLRGEFPEARFTGWLGPDEVINTLRGARALVCPSSWYEVQPLVPLEAAAQGVPAIVSDVGAFREAVQDGVTGLWFRGGDVDDLAAKLARLDGDPDYAARLGRNAYDAFWSQPQGLDVHLDGLEAIYADLRAA